ncbi:transcription repressor NadR [Listeria ivanovii]|uniref:Transcription repressor NadR n=2 Tax=Listeria ivanovii TaxID=1638 RepID=A0ABS1G8A9_LISIV|nr:transcription repressor NadR [Listeria ivanovii]EFR96314.1 3H domain-containing protein [Listeria ivanovii FSL F6-596]AIS60423.1 transcriptional regulator [Listeria ivanovii subsp. londoniensis]AIS63248.1 transcriptional regulator [Listeria ivanovii subsp. londoniensis]MBC2255958.1 transcription repressor NadR [Listeria ivanovii]MBK1963124.1 transcription repressor NadR [Listeria ivanovii subsp. londoniensis]
MKKILGDERRKLILKWLKETDSPISGNQIASRTNVSRQVIVQDISLLKAGNEPIMATPQGYIYAEEKSFTGEKRVIAVKHTKEQAAEELNILVDHGVTVIDVIVDHPIYGEITASLHLKNRLDVEKFVKKLQTTGAAMLSGLTDGTHLHTLEADTKEQIELAVQELEKAGFLI